MPLPTHLQRYCDPVSLVQELVVSLCLFVNASGNNFERKMIISFSIFFSRVRATLQPALSVGWLVGWLVTLYFFL